MPCTACIVVLLFHTVSMSKYRTLPYNSVAVTWNFIICLNFSVRSSVYIKCNITKLTIIIDIVSRMIVRSSLRYGVVMVLGGGRLLYIFDGKPSTFYLHCL